MLLLHSVAHLSGHDTGSGNPGADRRSLLRSSRTRKRRRYSSRSCPQSPANNMVVPSSWPSAMLTPKSTAPVRVAGYRGQFHLICGSFSGRRNSRRHCHRRTSAIRHSQQTEPGGSVGHGYGSAVGAALIDGQAGHHLSIGHSEVRGAVGIPGKLSLSA